jgi:hypothetical protein
MARGWALTGPPFGVNAGRPWLARRTLVHAPTQTANDTLFYWGGAGFANYYYFNSADATSWENSGGSTPVYPAGFYAGDGSPMPVYPQVNQGFFLYHNGPSITWTNAYTVQP